MIQSFQAAESLTIAIGTQYKSLTLFDDENFFLSYRYLMFIRHRQPSRREYFQCFLGGIGSSIFSEARRNILVVVCTCSRKDLQQRVSLSVYLTAPFLALNLGTEYVAAASILFDQY